MELNLAKLKGSLKNRYSCGAVCGMNSLESVEKTAAAYWI
jgi:hypothetical protein